MIASARSSGLNECPEMPSIMGAEPRPRSTSAPSKFTAPVLARQSQRQPHRTDGSRVLSPPEANLLRGPHATPQEAEDVDRARSRARSQYPISDVIISSAPRLWNPKNARSKVPGRTTSLALRFFFRRVHNTALKTRTARAMSDLARTQRRAPTLSCPRCEAAMEAIVSIELTLGEPGLIGYECPKCVYVTSELVQPTGSAKPVR
jgi:hypothetical protein